MGSQAGPSYGRIGSVKKAGLRMTRSAKLGWLGAGLLASALTLACEQRKTASPAASGTAPLGTPRTSASPAADEAAPPPASPETEEPEATLDGSASGLFIADQLVDVAPAGPASASTAGIVLVTKGDEVKLARLGPLSRAATPERSPVSELEAGDEQFAPLARGPAIIGGRAYWISKNRLVRAPVAGGEVEVLASDARRYTRVAAVGQTRSAPEAVAYLATKPSDPTSLCARLWVEGHGSVDLSPEGSGASSVALAANESGWVALMLEGRTGMTPLHARPIRFGNGSPRLGDDVVVWVGGSAQSLSEVHAIGDTDHSWAFLAIERDVTHFGLAKIRVDALPRTGSDVAWRHYPNGLDPAPMAVERVCGRPLLLYARPSSEQPHAPQELCAAPIEADVFGPAQVLARARAFSDVSIAALPGGALVSYVADRRTWAMTLRCPSR